MAGRQVIDMPNGDPQVDPFGKKAGVEKWFAQTNPNGTINYNHYLDIVDSKTSELLVKFIYDLSTGKNSPRDGVKRARSYTTLHGYICRLPKFLSRIEEFFKKPITGVTEDEILQYFKGMESGIIKRLDDKNYTDVKSYAKTFSAFWKWYCRVMHKEGTEIYDISYNLNLVKKRKPTWNYVTIDQVREMADLAPTLYYKALVLFLFDSGIRPPKELMNVRVKDITPVPNSDKLFLQIRDDTAKTFGRKIKLMICPETLKKYLKHSKKQPDDFLFHKTYANTNIQIKKLGYKVLGIGKMVKVKGSYRVRGGIRMYDLRHSSVCHYLPLYDSENQLKYRYGWAEAQMIHYYSEYIGMRDTITEDSMVDENTRVKLEVELEKEKARSAMLQEKFESQQKEMDEKFKKLESLMMQRFAEG